MDELEAPKSDTSARGVASKRMAAKLLAGWCMMAENCSACSEAPYMKSKQGELYCASCDRTWPAEQMKLGGALTEQHTATDANAQGTTSTKLKAPNAASSRLSPPAFLAKSVEGSSSVDGTTTFPSTTAPSPSSSTSTPCAPRKVAGVLRGLQASSASTGGADEKEALGEAAQWGGKIVGEIPLENSEQLEGEIGKAVGALTAIQVDEKRLGEVSPDLVRWREEIFKRSGVQVGKWMKSSFEAVGGANAKKDCTTSSGRKVSESEDEDSSALEKNQSRGGAPRGPLGFGLRQGGRYFSASSSSSNPPFSSANGNNNLFNGNIGLTAGKKSNHVYYGAPDDSSSTTARRTPLWLLGGRAGAASRRSWRERGRGERTALEALADLAKRISSASMNAALAAKAAFEASASAPPNSPERREAIKAANDCASAAATASTTAALLAEEVAMEVAAFVASHPLAASNEVVEEASSFLKGRHLRHYWPTNGESKDTDTTARRLPIISDARLMDIRETAKQWMDEADLDDTSSGNQSALLSPSLRIEAGKELSVFTSMTNAETMEQAARILRALSTFRTSVEKEMSKCRQEELPKLWRRYGDIMDMVSYFVDVRAAAVAAAAGEL